MKATSTFTVTSFEPTEYTTPIQTGSTVGFAYMDKRFAGDLEGISRTQFTFAFNHDTGVGTYVAMESFEGSLGGREGTFNFAHSASTTGTDRSQELVVIVPGSGTGSLTGLTGTGELIIDADDTHHCNFDYSLP